MPILLIYSILWATSWRKKCLGQISTILAKKIQIVVNNFYELLLNLLCIENLIEISIGRVRIGHARIRQRIAHTKNTRKKKNSKRLF